MIATLRESHTTHINQMKLLTAAAVIATSFVVKTPAEANPHQCTFNGIRESCHLTRLGNDTTVIRWLSDNKVVTYQRYNCQDKPGSVVCDVKITEDNGRVSYGRYEGGGRGAYIESNNGNVTTYPPFL